MQIADFRRRMREVVGAVHAGLRATRESLAGDAVTPSSQGSTLDRNSKILYAVDRTAFGLEIGPSFSPIARKADGLHLLERRRVEFRRAGLGMVHLLAVRRARLHVVRSQRVLRAEDRRRRSREGISLDINAMLRIVY